MSLIFPNQTLGIITEYNPFHNGHRYHIEASKKETGSHTVIAVMSGHFTQRGEPALFDPWTRAKWALLNGVDLVIELPVIFSTASAAYFAHGAIYLLSALGVDTLCFGSESGDIRQLSHVARLTNDMKASLKSQTLQQNDKSYSVLRSEQLNKEGFDSINRANDILGIAYLEALLNLQSPIKPHTIKRAVNDYHSLDLSQAIVSATAIRSALGDAQQTREQLLHTMPFETYATLLNESQRQADMRQWHDWILMLLRKHSPEELSHIHDMAVGLPERLTTMAANAHHYSDFEKAIQTKIFTSGRLRRVLAKMVLGIEKTDLLNDEATAPQYIRILGFTENGRSFLNRAKPNLPVITNGKNYIPDSEISKRHWQLDNRAANLHALLRKETAVSGSEMRTPPVYIK